MDEAANILYLRILKNPQDQLSYQNFSQNLLDATLRIAATNGEVEVVRKLLDQSEASPTSLDEDGKTPLHHAAAGGHCGVIKILLERGNAQQRYYIDTIDNAKKGKVALYYSVSGGHGDATKLLIAERANLDVRNDYGKTLLHQLAESGNEMAVRFLFEQLRLPSIDLEDNLLNTPLYAAVKRGRVSMARLLAEYGANKNVKDKDGETMFHKASRTGDTRAIQPLLEIGLDPFALTNKGENILYTAARHKQEGFMKELLTAIIPKHGTGKAPFCAREDDPNHWGLLHHAASQGCLDTIKALLSVAEEAGVGLDINELDSLGRPPLYLAAETGRDKVVELLEARGANVDTLDARGRTFLHRAIREGNVAAANILATRETSPNLNSIKDNDGNIPLHLAGENAYEAVKSLLEKELGSYLSQRNKLGRNPLHEVAASNDSAAGILGLYLQYGKPLWLRWFKDGNEENALHLAVLKGNVQMVRQLLHPDRLAKKQIEAKDKALETALHKAARYGYVAIAQLLLEKGSSEVERDIKGRIPLHTAARGGKSEVVKVFKFRIGLNNENVKVTWEEYEAFKDNDHKTPYELAVESEDEATIELFSKPRDPNDTSVEAACESSQKEVLPLQHGAEQDSEPDSVQEEPKESEREQALEREIINGSQEQEQDQDQDRASTKRENSSEGLAHQTSGLGIVSSPDPAERQPPQHIINTAIPSSSPEDVDDLTPTEEAGLPPTVIVGQPPGDDPSIGATDNGNNLDELSSAKDSTSNGHSSDHFCEGCTENHTVQPEAPSTRELENTSEGGYTLEDTPQPESQFTPEDHDLRKAVTPQLIEETSDNKAQGARDYTYNDTRPCSQTSERKEPLDSENAPQPRNLAPTSETTGHHSKGDNAHPETPRTLMFDPSNQDTEKLGATTGEPQSGVPKELDHGHDSEKESSDNATTSMVCKTVDDVDSPYTDAAIDSAPQSGLPIKYETNVSIIVGDDDYKKSGAAGLPMPYPNNNGPKNTDIDDDNPHATGFETNHEKVDGDSGASETVSTSPSPTVIPASGNSGQENSSTSSSTSQRVGPNTTDHAPPQLDSDYEAPEPEVPVETGHTSEELCTSATAHQPVAPEISQGAPQKEGTGSNTPQLAPVIFNDHDSGKSDADTNEVSPALSETGSIAENEDINTISPQLTGTKAKNAPGKSDNSSGTPTQVVRSTDGTSNASSEGGLNEHSDQSEGIVSKGSHDQEEGGTNDNSSQNTVSQGGDCPQEVETVDSAPLPPSSEDKNTSAKTETNDSSSDPAVLTPKPTLGEVYSDSSDYQSTDTLSGTGSSHGVFDPNGSGEPPAGSTSELKPRHTSEVVGLDETHPQPNASQIDGNEPEQKDVTNKTQGSENISQLELNGPPALSIASSSNEGNHNQDISQPGVLTGPLTTTISSPQKALEAHEIEMPVLDSKESKPSDIATPQPHNMELENPRGGQEEKGSVTSTISENEPQSIIIPAQDNVPQIPKFDVIDTIEDPSPTNLENDSQEKDSPNSSHTIPPPQGNLGEGLTEDSVMDSPSTSTNAANGNGGNSKGVCDGTTNTNSVDDTASQSEINRSVKVPYFSSSDTLGEFSNNSNDGSPPKSTATISNPSLVPSSSPDKALDDIETSLRDVEGGDCENTTTDEAATGDPHSDSEEDHDNEEKNSPVPENTTEDFPTFSTGTIDNPGENITDSPNQTSASPISPEPLTSNPVHTDQESQPRDQPAEASSAPLEPGFGGLQQHTAENTDKSELDSIKNPSPVEEKSTSNKSEHDIPHLCAPNSSDLTTMESSEPQKPDDDAPPLYSTTSTTFSQENTTLMDAQSGSAQQYITSNTEESSVDQSNGPPISSPEQSNPHLARQTLLEPLPQISEHPTPPIPARVKIESNNKPHPVTQTTGGAGKSIKSSETTFEDPSEQCSITENGSVDENIAPVNLEHSDTQSCQSPANKDSAENTQTVQIIPTTPVTASDAVHDYPGSQSQEAINTEDPSDSTNEESTMPIRPENSPPNNTTATGEHVSDYNEGLSGEEASDTEALPQSPFFGNFPNVSSRRLMGPESSSDSAHRKGSDPKKVVNGFDVDTPLMFHPNSPFSAQSSDPQGSSAQDSTEDISGDSTKSGAMGVGLGVSLPQNTTTDNNHGHSTPEAATDCESSLSGGNLNTVSALTSRLNDTITVATTAASENATIPPIASPVKIDIVPAGTTTSKSTIVVPSTTSSPLNTESAALTSDSTSVPPPIANLLSSGNPATVAGVLSDIIRAPLTVANLSSGNITALETSVAQNRARTPPPTTDRPLSSAVEAIAGVPANNIVATETAVPSNGTSSSSITNSLPNGSSVEVIGNALLPPANPPSNGVAVPEIAVNPDGTNASPSTTGSPFSSTPVAIAVTPLNITSATGTGATCTSTSSSVANPLPSSTPATATGALLNNATTAGNSVPPNNTSTSLSITIPQSNSAPAPTAGLSPDKTSASPSAANVEQNNAIPMATTTAPSGTNASPSIRNSLSNGLTAAKTRVTSAASSVKNWFFRTSIPVNSGDPRGTQSDIRETSQNGNPHDTESSAASTSNWEVVDFEEEPGYIYSVGVSTPFQISYYDIISLNDGSFRSRGMEKILRILAKSRTVKEIPSLASTRYYRGVLHRQNEPIQPNIRNINSNMKKMTKRSINEAEKSRITTWLATKGGITGPSKISETVEIAPNNSSIFLIEIDECCRFQDEDELDNCLRRTVIACFDHYKIQEDGAEAIIFILTCSISALQGTDCQATDIACICQSNEFIGNLAPCARETCTESEVDQTIRAAQQLCASAGVTLSVPPTATARGTSTSSSTTPASVTSTTVSSSEPLTTQTTSRTTMTTTERGATGQPSPSSTSPPNNTPTLGPVPNSGSSLSTGAIVGIAVGVGALVIALIVCLYVIYRLKSQKKTVPVATSNGSPTDQLGGIGPDNDLPGQIVTGGRG
ncbi:Transient receptor putative cation channel sub A member 1 [Orbilia oligospora]|nr:Transient receptor putative cation channel sub A member 1 [Orbilia oligospora]